MNHSLIAAALVAASTPVFAEIDPIVIIGDRYETQLNELPQAVQVIDRQQLEESGARNVGDMLRLLPQISVTDSVGAGNLPVIRMRAYGPSNVLVLVDGSPISTSTLAGPALNSVPISQIERIEVMEGSAGVLFGSAAVSGVLNIVTSQLDETSLTAKAGSFGYGQIEVATSESIKYGTLALAIAETTSDGYRDHTDYDESKLTARFSREHNDLNHSVQLFALKTESKYLSGNSLEALEANPRSGRTENLNNRDALRLAYQLEARTASHIKSVNAQAYTSKQDGRISGNLFTQSTNELSISPVIRWADTGWLAGIDLKDTTLDYASPTATYGTTKRESDQTVASIFSRRNHQLSDDLRLVYGGRLSHLDETIYREKRTGPIGSAIEMKSPTRSSTQEAFELAVFYDLTPSQSVFGRIDQHFRFPNVGEQNGFSGFPQLLKDQTGQSYELGYRFNSSGLTLNANLYFNQLENEIAFQSVSGSRYGNFNLEKTERVGGSVKIELPVSETTALALNIALVDAEITGGAHQGKKVPLVAEESITFDLTKAWTNDVTTKLTSAYISERALGSDYDNLGEPMMSELRHDFSIAKRFVKSDVALTVTNLLDDKLYGYGVYAEAFGGTPAGAYYTPSLPRSIQISFKTRF